MNDRSCDHEWFADVQRLTDAFQRRQIRQQTIVNNRIISSIFKATLVFKIYSIVGHRDKITNYEYKSKPIVKQCY